MRVMALDCEFNQPSRKTIQIGAAVYDVRSGDQIATLELYVNPHEPIQEFIIGLTGITDKDVENAPSIKEAFLQLKEFHQKWQVFMNPIVWGSGVRNDSLAIYEESKVEEPNFMGYRIIDAKTVYQSLQIFRNKGVKGGLEAACDKLGIGFIGDPHRALTDAQNTFRLWHFLMRRFYDNFKEEEKLELFARKAVRK